MACNLVVSDPDVPSLADDFLKLQSKIQFDSKTASSITAKIEQYQTKLSASLNTLELLRKRESAIQTIIEKIKDADSITKLYKNFGDYMIQITHEIVELKVDSGILSEIFKDVVKSPRSNRALLIYDASAMLDKMLDSLDRRIPIAVASAESCVKQIVQTLLKPKDQPKPSSKWWSLDFINE